MKNKLYDHTGLRVGIACNIKTDHGSDMQAEFDEPETVAAICGALEKEGYVPIVLEATTDFPKKLTAEAPDIVFNIAEGKSGRNREAQIPAILEYYDVPYTGSDAATLSIALDKALTKSIVEDAGVQTPSFFTLKKGFTVLPDEISYPVLVKPNAEGSSKGVSDTCVAKNRDELQTLVENQMTLYDEDLLCEQYIDGREFTVGIIGNGEDAHVFEPMEIIYHKLRGEYKIYSFEVKRNYREYISYKCPPDISAEVSTCMKQYAKKVYDRLGCVDFTRIDFRLSSDGKVYFIEANPLPGLAPGYSDFPMLAGFNGIEYDTIVCRVLKCALKRYEMKG